MLVLGFFVDCGGSWFEKGIGQVLVLGLVVDPVSAKRVSLPPPYIYAQWRGFRICEVKAWGMRFSALLKGKSPSHPKPIADFGRENIVAVRKKFLVY